MGEKAGAGEFFEEDMGDNEDVYPELPNIFNDKLNWKEQEPVLGMRFESPKQLKHMLCNYAVANGYQLCFVKNDTRRLLVKCCDGKWELLCAVGRDANNGIFLIAWAVVSVENKEIWKWFLETLSEDLQCWNDGVGDDEVIVDATDALDRPRDEERMVGVNGRDEGVNVNARVKHGKPPKMRKKSERIIKLKLAKNVGGEGSSVATAMDLD
ncbi:unnamed protein product [Lactuca saligna]|uniref:Transposase MuDR plant domain-containing protein n=1 Tax=Lactuca saligna TaxID=75948 RepID=A0AA36EEK0_LACSI|nr:unnamed protein product [Lactuca saligna]